MTTSFVSPRSTLRNLVYAYVAAPAILFWMLRWHIYYTDTIHFSCVLAAALVVACTMPYVAPFVHRVFNLDGPVTGKEFLKIWLVTGAATYGWILVALATVSPLIGERMKMPIQVVQTEECTSRCNGCNKTAKVEMWRDVFSTVCADDVEHMLAPTDFLVVDGYVLPGVVYIKSIHAK